MISFFCVLAPEGMNAIVFGEIKGERSEVCYLLERYIIKKKKDDILPQYSSEFIVYNDSWRYHLISMTASRRQYQNKPQPSVHFLIFFPKTTAFTPSEAKTQKIKMEGYRKRNTRVSK